MKKTKSNLKNVPARDVCQTPPYALIPLLRKMQPGLRIWEPAAGEGLLAETLKQSQYDVWETDLDQGIDFFKASFLCDAIVTNPPFSLKYEWLERCYELGHPFALLMPVDVFGAATAQRLFEKYCVTVMLLDKRVNFKMPNLGWDGKGADYSVAWFTWQLLPTDRQLVYGTIPALKTLPKWMVKPENRQEIVEAPWS